LEGEKGFFKLQNEDNNQYSHPNCQNYKTTQQDPL